MPTAPSTPPLADALGLKRGMRVLTIDMPADVRRQLGIDDIGLELLAAPCTGIDAALVFVSDRDRLERELRALSQLIAPGGFIWLAWPETQRDLTAENVTRTAQDCQLADIDARSVASGWSSVKLMLRKEAR